MGVYDPDPNIRSADRGGLNTIASAVTSTTGYAFASNAKPANSVAYARVPNHTGQTNPNAFFQVDVSTGTASGNFIASNDLQKWYSIGTWDQTNGAYALPLLAGYRYVSASIDAVSGGASVTISADL